MVLWLLNSLGTIMIALMMALIVTDVAGRSFFNAPLNGVAEICAMMIVAIVFLQLAATIHAQRMTRGARPRGGGGWQRFALLSGQKRQAVAASAQLFAILENSETPSVRTWRAFIMIAKSRSIS